jgi:hypothetical protein
MTAQWIHVLLAVVMVLTGAVLLFGKFEPAPPAKPKIEFAPPSGKPPIYTNCEAYDNRPHGKQQKFYLTGGGPRKVVTLADGNEFTYQEISGTDKLDALTCAGFTVWTEDEWRQFTALADKP